MENLFNKLDEIEESESRYETAKADFAKEFYDFLIRENISLVRLAAYCGTWVANIRTAVRKGDAAFLRPICKNLTLDIVRRCDTKGKKLRKFDV